MKILDVGCGRKKRQNAIGIDRVKLPSVDIIADAETANLPFKNGVFDKIICRHLFEHLRSEQRIKLLREFHRLLRDSGIVEITAPHKYSYTSAIDPTHKDTDLLVLHMFDYFSPIHKYNYYFDFCFEIISREFTRITVDLPIPNIATAILNKIIMKIANKWERILQIIPIYLVNMKFVLKKVPRGDDFVKYT